MSDQATVTRWAIDVDPDGRVWLRGSDGQREELACYDLRFGLAKGNRVRAQWPSPDEDPRRRGR
jgi:cephalosporin-C deacetylase-like acetyl esterase